MIEIPANQLVPETLDAVITEFVLREGTDYGEREIDLEEKINRVRRDLREGRIVLVFDEDLESCNLLTKLEFQRLSLGPETFGQ